MAAVQSRRPVRKFGLIVVSVVSLLAIDSLAGLVYRTDTTARIHVTDPPSGRAREVVVVFPGFIMAGDQLSAAFAPHLPADEGMVVVQYAERGLDIAQIYTAVMAEVDRLNPQQLRIYGGSMGGMCAASFLDLYSRHGSRYGAPILVLDTTPTTTADIKRPGWLYAISSLYRGGPLSTALVAGASALVTPPQSEAGVDERAVAAAHRAGAWVGMPALTSQASFISGFAPPPAPNPAPLRVAYLQGEDPDTDRLIRVSQAVDGWRRIFPDLKVVTVAGRAGRWHLPIVERPRETVTALLAA